jgi:hypothetical protein
MVQQSSRTWFRNRSVYTCTPSKGLACFIQNGSFHLRVMVGSTTACIALLRSGAGSLLQLQ